MDNTLCERRMSEAELLSSFEDAVNYDHIFVCYQAQINHSTGRMVGAEALMRWKHPLYGLQYPSDFIPVLEKNNLIYKADLHVFDMVCRFQKRCMEEGIAIVPISVNMSRYDIYNHNYVEEIEAIRKKYDVPVKYLRIEITESSAIGGMELVSSVLSKLHEYGYLVEMDDFGSGYSSLNILKDLDVDIIKLDMKFMSGNMGGRGGTILSSIVQMAKWLNTPVIAEGVETMEIADYLKSIGCNYIQGYLYSRPTPPEDFISVIKEINHEPLTPAMELYNDMDTGKFWNPESMETLIFSNFAGPACVFVYSTTDRTIEILRMNKKYVKEVGNGRTEKEIIKANPWDDHDEKSRKDYEDALLRAIESNDEEVVENWREICTKICGTDKICIRSYIRVIGKGEDKYLFYAMVQNITKEKKMLAERDEKELVLKNAFEHANVYAWEVNLSTWDMRPCFRCMRDLQLPPVIHNYPEPVIENGLFPPDYADMYRDWMKQLASGVEKLEAIIPLTVGRVPFHVRYTTEFDETGKPLKAYGSATLVVDDDKEK
ncbi:MAG: EAL domain-containing protein [Eubacterium sp.]|nr:EAL domain-containing protein [Eubacterium sp.]